jgi:hypothetical protein
MTKYRVTFALEGGWDVDYTKEVMADSPEEAKRKVKGDIPKAYNLWVREVK